MKINLLLLPFAMAVLYTPAIGAATSSVGCADPGVLSNALKSVGDRDWMLLSEANLRTIWPTELGSLDCNDAACQTLQQKGKVFGEQCECCELFNFDIDRDDKGAVVRERMYSIVIYYSASEKRKTVEAVRNLARALGASDSDALKISDKPQQQLYWTTSHGQTKKVTLMEMHLKHQQSGWRVYAYFSRHAA